MRVDRLIDRGQRGVVGDRSGYDTLEFITRPMVGKLWGSSLTVYWVLEKDLAIVDTFHRSISPQCLFLSMLLLLRLGLLLISLGVTIHDIFLGEVQSFFFLFLHLFLQLQKLFTDKCKFLKLHLCKIQLPFLLLPLQFEYLWHLILNKIGIIKVILKHLSLKRRL